MADPLRKLERARRDGRRFAADARRLAAGRRAGLDAPARKAILAACDDVEAAAGSGEPDRLSAALRDLDALWEAHLARLAKPAWREVLEVVALAVLLALLVRAFAFESYRIPSGSMAPTLVPGDHVLVSKAAYGLRIPGLGLRLGGGAPRRGDVVVFESPRVPGTDTVKRVVGVPGDVIELREQVLHVNGVPQPRTPGEEVAYEERADETGRPFQETCRRYREALAKGPFPPSNDPDPAALEASWQAAAAAGVASYDILQCRRARLAAREGPYQVVAADHVFVLGDNRDRSADSRGAGGWLVPVDRVHGRVSRVLVSWGRGGVPVRDGAGPRIDRLLKTVE